MAGDEPPTDRRSPVGEPVIRGDSAIAGERAAEAIAFDPEDPESVATAVETVRSFARTAENGRGTAAEDTLRMLRGAAACAALVRAEGSYKAACARAGDGVTVSFVRKWARVHDLPRAVRIHVAKGDIPPTAAKHIARVTGQDRYDLAWATLDHDLTVRQLRAIASDVDDGTTAAEALRARGIDLGTVELDLDRRAYRTLRRRAALEGVPPGELVSDAVEAAPDPGSDADGG